MGANVGTTVTGQIIRLLDLNASGTSILQFFKPSTLAPLAMIAGIITTRGWLIYDEYILKTLSKAYTLIVIILVILCFSWLIINGRYL